MPEDKYPYIKVRDWLENYYVKRGITTYRGLEGSTEFAGDLKKAKVKFHIDPMLPLDLVAIEEKRRAEYHYTLFWVILSSPETEGLRNLKEDLESRLPFYQFYLSRVSELTRWKIIIVILAGSENNLRRSLQEIAERNKFGLWQIDTDKEEPEQICKPMTFRERMEWGFRDFLTEKHFKEPVRKEAQKIALFSDSYIRNAVEAMAGVSPEEMGKRYIERMLLDLAFDFQNISFRETLSNGIAQHLSFKDDEYEFVKDTFSNLWRECDLKIGYSDVSQTYDPMAYQVSAMIGRPYRDHHLHQFQVFLLGLDIIDKFYSDFQKFWEDYLRTLKLMPKIKIGIEVPWLVASSFHDMARPLESYEEYAKMFIGKLLGTTEEVETLDLKSHFIDRTFLACMGSVITSFCQVHRGKIPPNWPATEEELVQFFYNKITKSKHHCVLSSIHLLKEAYSKRNAGVNDELINSVFAPSALAIALHDENIWNELKRSHRFNSLECEKDPISFLLMFCDNAQEFGRKEKEERFLLKEGPLAEKGKYELTLWTPTHISTADFCRKKQTDLSALRSFLREPKGINFTIRLQDKENTVFDTSRMTGPES